MILVALGSNLSHLEIGAPADILAAACAALEAAGLTIRARSRLYRSPPWPPSDQPWYVNAVVAVAPQPGMTAASLLQRLHAIEADFGRKRGRANAARVLDLDLLDFEGEISRPGATPVLPHPRLAERAFVLLPLADVAPAWRHPVSGLSLVELRAALPPDQIAEPMDRGFVG